jgi:hypothetical protein
VHCRSANLEIAVIYIIAILLLILAVANEKARGILIMLIVLAICTAGAVSPNSLQ